MKREHLYTHRLKWTGDSVDTSIKNDRLYTVSIEGKPIIKGSADKVFHGDGSLYNPEDMLLAALGSCHMMSFFYVCRKKGLRVSSYEDNPVGVLKLNNDGSGQFTKVSLRPKVELLAELDKTELMSLHKEAGKLCFIANSCAFDIVYEPQ